MPFDLLLPPLLGGYLFLIRFNGTAYRVSSLSGYRFMFEVSIAGLAVLLCAAISIQVLKSSSDQVVYHHIAISLSSVAIIAMLYGALKLVKIKLEQARLADKMMDEAPGAAALWYPDAARDYYKSLLVTSGCLLSLVIGAIHASTAGAAIFSLWSVAWFGFFLVVAYFLVQRLKSLSGMRGYDVALRLGGTFLVGSMAFMLSTTLYEAVSELFRSIAPFDYSGHAMLALIYGVLAPTVFNAFFPYEAAIDRMIENGQVDGLQLLLHHATSTLQQVMITLADGKVYVGYVDDEIPIAGRTDDFVRIVPTLSGYRQITDKRLRLVTSYADALKQVADDGEAFDERDLHKTLRLSEISSASIFDPDLFERFEGR